MKVFFTNCPSCPNGAFEVTDDTPISELLSHCRERWGAGRLVRTRPQGELVWIKNSDEDGDWRGCCAEKLKGKS